MRNTALGFAFVVLVALGAGTGWYWWTAWRFQQSTDDAYVQSDITVISPKIEGYIKEVRVEENQQVAAGQVLIIVGDRAGRAGQYVKPGTQLLSLVPLPHVYVTANFKETQLTHMRPGQSAEISVDAYPDQPLRGHIEIGR